MSSASSVLPSDLVSVEVAAQQVGAHPQTSLTRCTFPVLYPVPAPERGPRWQTHAQRRNLQSDQRGTLVILPGIWVKWEARSGSGSPVILDPHHAAHVASACRRLLLSRAQPGQCPL